VANKFIGPNGEKKECIKLYGDAMAVSKTLLSNSLTR